MQAVSATLYSMAKDDRRRLFGQHGEQRAAQFLQDLGYTIVNRNYRCQRGEIDLVARDKETLVFVEVRTHRSREFGDPLASINRRKQRQIAMTALHYLSRFHLHDRAARFDVIGIMGEGEAAQLTHIKSAFEFPTSR